MKTPPTHQPGWRSHNTSRPGCVNLGFSFGSLGVLWDCQNISCQVGQLKWILQPAQAFWVGCLFRFEEAHNMLWSRWWLSHQLRLHLFKAATSFLGSHDYTIQERDAAGFAILNAQYFESALLYIIKPTRWPLAEIPPLGEDVQEWTSLCDTLVNCTWNYSIIRWWGARSRFVWVEGFWTE